MAALDAQLARRARLEVARLMQPSDERAQRQEHQAQATVALRDVDAQHAAVEPLAQPDVEALHPVDVVADEHERRAPPLRDAVELERELEERVTAQHHVRCPQHRVPLAAAEPAPLLFAPAHDLGVKADARVVDEHAAVDLADIHRFALSLD